MHGRFAAVGRSVLDPLGFVFAPTQLLFFPSLIILAGALVVAAAPRRVAAAYPPVSKMVRWLPARTRVARQLYRIARPAGSVLLLAIAASHGGGSTMRNSLILTGCCSTSRPLPLGLQMLRLAGVANDA